MNKKILVSVLVFILVIIGVWYFVKKPISQNLQTTKSSLEARSISSAYIYGPELNKVKVYLYAPDEKKTAITSDYCGGKAGSEVHGGNYQLVIDSATATSDNPGGNSDIKWNDSTLNIGQIEFVKNYLWDGKITVDQFDPNGYKNFIILQKYGSCNGPVMQIFGYDFSRGKQFRTSFKTLE